MKKLNRDSVATPQNGYLFLILGIAGFLRFYKLEFQSLWLDELYTLLESDPDISWSDTLSQVATNENKSPLYFFIVKLFCLIFGHTAFVARAVSAFAGVLSVYFIYQLGKESKDVRTGLFLALLTAINPFHLYYSQEARGYIFVFLFTVLSTLYLFRLIKEAGFKNAFCFGLFSILISYFHPFGLIILVAQSISYFVYLFSQKTDFKGYSKAPLLFLSVILVGLIPLIKPLFSTTQLGSSWIDAPELDFFIVYFYNFFGNALFLKPLLILCYLFYFIYFFGLDSKTAEQANLSQLRLSLYNSVLIVFCCILIPYFYSIYKTPALVIRYMIIVLPTLLLILAQALSLVKHKKTGLFFLMLFVILSLSDTLFLKNYYTKITKTQFRELSEYIKSNNEKTTVILNEKTAWHQSYYLKKMSVSSPLISESKEIFIDSLLKKLERKEAVGFEAFWLVGAHLDPKPTNEFNRKLNRYFIPLKSRDFFDAWAYLYLVNNSEAANSIKLSCRDFPDMHRGLLNGDSIVTLWEQGARDSRRVYLPGGAFEISLLTKGTALGNIYPHLNVYVNNRKVGSFFTDKDFSLSPRLKFTLENADSVYFRIVMDNDSNDAITKEDRNAFIKGIYIFKK